MRTSGRLRSVYRTVLYGTVPAGAEKEKTDKRGNVSEFPLTPPHAYTVEVEVHSLVISQHRAQSQPDFEEEVGVVVARGALEFGVTGDTFCV